MIYPVRINLAGKKESPESFHKLQWHCLTKTKDEYGIVPVVYGPCGELYWGWSPGLFLMEQNSTERQARVVSFLASNSPAVSSLPFERAGKPSKAEYRAKPEKTRAIICTNLLLLGIGTHEHL